MGFLRRLWLYLLGKVSEVKQLQYRDALAASVITEIQARKTSESTQLLPIDRLQYFHAIDRESALEKLHERERILEEHKDALLEREALTKEWMVENFPSITHFKVVPYADDYVVYDGNGRLKAMKNVLGDGVSVEVDVLDIPKDIEPRIRKVRRLNGLE